MKTTNFKQLWLFHKYYKIHFLSVFLHNLIFFNKNSNSLISEKVQSEDIKLNAVSVIIFNNFLQKKPNGVKLIP